MEQGDSEFKVGIIGPKPFSYGGHDCNGEFRKFTKNCIKKILKKHQYNYGKVIGITGLGIGAEQDFAEVCIEMKIGFSGYIPYPNMESTIKKIPKAQEKYEMLREKSLGIKEISRSSHYSPKKNQKKNAEIIAECDAIIYIHDSLCAKEECSIYREIMAKEKILDVIYTRSIFTTI